jgi:hypothetical protein
VQVSSIEDQEVSMIVMGSSCHQMALLQLMQHCGGRAGCHAQQRTILVTTVGTLKLSTRVVLDVVVCCCPYSAELN